MRILQLLLAFLATRRKRTLPIERNLLQANQPKDGPQAEYTRRLSERRDELERCRALHRRFWIYLIVSATAATGIGLLALSSRVDAGWILPLPLALAVFSFHALTRNARLHSRLSKIVAFYESGIERLTNRWQGCGNGGNEFRSEDHLYATDLDAFGAGSLFEFLCTARTGIGRGMLADWLLHPAEPKEIVRRHQAVAELRDRLDLREEWASVGEVIVEQVEMSHLSDWATAAVAEAAPVLHTLAVVLPISLVAGVLLGLGFPTSHWLLIIGALLAMQAQVAAALWRKTRAVADNIVLPSFELGTIAPLLSCLEKQQFKCSLLRALQARLFDGPLRSSQQLARLRGLALLLDLRRSEYFAAVLSLVLWGTNLAFAVEWWRERNRARLPEWLETLGQFEALFCLARYAYENPEHTFPILRQDVSALFQADSLGHPLLAWTGCVPCNVTLNSDCRFLMVSGSNMSGKSTLLRSIGLNAVLAFAGAPVRASRLEISPLRIGCSIAVQDSLRQGKSRFQAEVARLKEIIAVAHEQTVLFLLDEMLGGTNSKDRILGARAVLDELVRSNAIGLITTHDLSLTELVTQVQGEGRNVHFEEQYRDGEMRFDYRMRPGRLTHTNGLNIIAAIGLRSW